MYSKLSCTTDVEDEAIMKLLRLSLWVYSPRCRPAARDPHNRKHQYESWSRLFTWKLYTGYKGS